MKCKITSKETKKEILEIIKNNDNVVIPTNIEEIKSPTSIKSQNISPKYEDDNYKAFAEYFENDLIGFIKNPKEIPVLRAFVPGGYGMKLIFENKYNDFSKIKTNDLDITVSIQNTKIENSQKARMYLIKKCYEFIKTRKDPKNFKIQIISLPTTYNPILKMRRFFVISILYNNDEFIDLVITDRVIMLEEMNSVISKKTLLPVKKDEGYFLEYFQIIYMENVPGIDNYCYLKRNPVTGKFSCKGVKDIDRVKNLCEISNTKSKYKKECSLVKEVSKESLQKMSKVERDKLFVELRDVI